MRFQCPLCRAEQGTVRETFGAYRVVACQACGVLATWPVPSAEVLQARYNQGYYAGPQAARFRHGFAEAAQRLFRRRRANALRRRLGGAQGKRILDVGCGRGYTLAWLQRWGADVYGTQIAEAAASVARRHIGSDRVFVGQLHEARYPAESFHAVCLWHVLEHVPDPQALLREIARILAPEGLVYIEVPNAGGWEVKRWGRHWLAYDVPNHVTHFTPETLARAASRAGLHPVDAVHFSWEYSPVTLLQTWLNAWLGGESLLFRSLTCEAAQEQEALRWRTARVMVHMAVASLLALPALAISLWLGRRRCGNTLGMYFQKFLSPDRVMMPGHLPACHAQGSPIPVAACMR